MKGSLALLDHLHGRKVAARMENGRLEDLLIDGPEDGPPPPGTLYRARVDRPAKGQGGAFVSLPDGSGFLRDGKGLAPGEPLLCQVTGYAEPGKAIPVTSRVLFKSKLAIVTPGAPGLNISRSIRDQEQRVRLRAVAESLDVPEGVGVILRSNAAEADDDAVEDDIAEMLTLASGLAEEVKGPPERLLDGPDAHHLAWREWGAPDSVETATGCLEDHGVLDELDALRGPQAALKGGGSLFVEPTRALIAVDVNTGNNFSTGASLKANIEASRDLPRQLRLRGLGGQITVDFAPLVKKDRKQLEQILRAAFRADPVETALVGWTPLGHFELQRKRERRPLLDCLP